MSTIAAAVVGVAERIFEDLRDTQVLCIGTGEPVELAAAGFAARQPRALERRAAPPEALDRFDIVVSGSGSVVPLIGLERVRHALRARKRRPMLMVDLARDISPEVARLEDVFLYTGEDLA